MSGNFRAAHTEIPWKQVKQMRNIVAHNYAKLDYVTTWNTVVNDIPQLADFCARTLAAETAD